MQRQNTLHIDILDCSSVIALCRAVQHSYISFISLAEDYAISANIIQLSGCALYSSGSQLEMFRIYVHISILRVRLNLVAFVVAVC